MLGGVEISYCKSTFVGIDYATHELFTFRHFRTGGNPQSAGRLRHILHVRPAAGRCVH